ncbi:cysteine--tRNA ligase [candidate division KSB1 bacterium]
MKNKNPIYIYNTLSKKKEEFIPLKDNEVSIYICGPTVYNFIHIGNARPLIFFDTVRRYFSYLGNKVIFVQNITDIDDKIIMQANKENTTVEEIADRYTKQFFDDNRSLGVSPPDHSPRATNYIKEMIELIKELQDDGLAYESDGNVFFEVSKFQGYGKLSGKDLNSMLEGQRVDEKIQSLKKNIEDFSLWKPAKPGEPAWDSLWGEGRPGWHTECVVMSTKILGSKFDIHGGGIDLIFPHHENEIAQAKCSNNDFANYWMHNEFLNIRNKKMAKSEGNVVLVKDAVKKYKVEAIRLFFLQTHYRKSIGFDDDSIISAENALERLSRVIQKAENLIKSGKTSEAKPEPLSSTYDYFNENVESFRQAFASNMHDDFNTPAALGELFKLVNQMQVILDSKLVTNNDISFLREGLDFINDVNTFLRILPTDEKASGVDDEKIENLIAKRNNFRKNREWDNADKIRDELLEMGIVLEDTKDGTSWWQK